MRKNKAGRNKEHLWIVSALLAERAVKIILVHNHPSGELQHSQKDYELTEQMWTIGKGIGVDIIMETTALTRKQVERLK